MCACVCVCVGAHTFHFGHPHTSFLLDASCPQYHSITLYWQVCMHVNTCVCGTWWDIPICVPALRASCAPTCYGPAPARLAGCRFASVRLSMPTPNACMFPLCVHAHSRVCTYTHLIASHSIFTPCTCACLEICQRLPHPWGWSLSCFFVLSVSCFSILF